MSTTGNSFGKVIRITTFGESHGKKIGVLLEGIPSGVPINVIEIERDLGKRRPGSSELVTPRDEKDQVEIVSGVFENKTTGAPIVLMTNNKDVRSEDYGPLKTLFRPSHADFTYFMKYGHYDYRGGGRASARETWGRVAAGSIIKSILKNFYGIEFIAYVSQIGTVALPFDFNHLSVKKKDIDQSLVRCPDEKVSNKMISLIKKVKNENDSLGGIIKCIVKNVPVGVGEPTFDRLEANLSKAMMSIPSVRGFEIGDGFLTAKMRGSEAIDEMRSGGENKKVKFISNHAGGVMGGISRGDEVIFNVAFRAPSTIQRKVRTIDRHFKGKILEMGGRHDPCVLPRAVPIVESMAAIAIYDLVVRDQLTRIESK